MNYLAFAYDLVLAIGGLLLAHAIFRRKSIPEIGLFSVVVLVGGLAVVSSYVAFLDTFLRIAGVVGLGLGIVLVYFIFRRKL